QDQPEPPSITFGTATSSGGSHRQRKCRQTPSRSPTSPPDSVPPGTPNQNHTYGLLNPNHNPQQPKDQDSTNVSPNRREKKGNGCLPTPIYSRFAGIEGDPTAALSPSLSRESPSSRPLVAALTSTCRSPDLLLCAVGFVEGTDTEREGETYSAPLDPAAARHARRRSPSSLLAVARHPLLPMEIEEGKW
ncbi:hypothetical protein Dimus_036016, partial [Dionaea muscipula]